MTDKNTIEKLRAMATQLLESSGNTVELNTMGYNVKDLLQELSIYHIELEHQNSELERSEKELAASREEYIELFENAPMGYVIIDDERKIYKLNRTFVDRFIPVHKQDISYEGHQFDEFVCPEYQNSFYLFCKMLHKSRVPIPVEVKLYDRFGNPHYVMITAGVRNPESALFRLAVSDISMQKKLEIQLVQAKEKAEENDRQKSLFLTSVSHEVRTPLTTIIGFIELLGNPGVSRDTLNEYIDSIKLSGKMLMALTDEVLDLSTLESGTIPLRNGNVDIVQVCSELVMLVQGEIKGKNVLIRNETDEIPILWADQMRLRQMIFAILSHAANNATEGTVVVRGRYVTNDQFNGFLILEFTGRNIFSGETNLDMSIQRKPVSQNCAGLGLFLARQIIKFMNGEMIWIHPLDSLRIEIPLEVSRFLEHDKTTNKSIATPTKKRTCLLVDDVVMNLKVLGAIIKLMNCVPTLVNSGREALELLATNRYDFIMTDLWMPEMNGEELAVMIRQNPAYDDIPIYAVTADVERENNFDREFFAKTITKPVNIDKIRRLFAAMDAESSIKDSKGSN